MKAAYSPLRCGGVEILHSKKRKYLKQYHKHVLQCSILVILLIYSYLLCSTQQGFISKTCELQFLHEQERQLGKSLGIKVGCCGDRRCYKRKKEERKFAVLFQSSRLCVSGEGKLRALLPLLSLCCWRSLTFNPLNLSTSHWSHLKLGFDLVSICVCVCVCVCVRVCVLFAALLHTCMQRWVKSEF